MWYSLLVFVFKLLITLGAKGLMRFQFNERLVSKIFLSGVTIYSRFTGLKFIVYYLASLSEKEIISDPAQIH